MEIDAESLGASGSVTAAVIAVVAAGVAIWPARIASSARDAAKDQARSAQEAVDVARAHLRIAEKPRFAVTVTTPPDGAVPWTAITMLEGPEVDANISWERTIYPRSNPRRWMTVPEKDGAGAAAPVVAALVDRVLEVAELLAQARGGRLDPPLTAVLDEAANVCPIRSLPQLYSHYGYRGLQVVTMLQNYQQGVGVWGTQGMDTLWSAATIKLIGAGIDDHTFLQRLSGLIGDHDVEKVSLSRQRGGRPSWQYTTTREPILPPSALRALPKTRAVLLSSGRHTGLGELRPWYWERDNAEIETYLSTALTELRAAATEALGPDNPVLAQSPTTGHTTPSSPTDGRKAPAWRRRR